MNRLLLVLLGTRHQPTERPSDRDHGLGTCRWCLNVIVVVRSAPGRSTPPRWMHLATGHATCLDPPMGALLTSTAQPLPAAPRRWDLLFPADTSRARIAWTLGIIGNADPATPATLAGQARSDRPWTDRNAQQDQGWPIARPRPPSAGGRPVEP